MKRFFHTLVALLLLAACTDGNNELGSKDPFSIPDKEGCNVKGTVFDDYGTPLEGIVVSDACKRPRPTATVIFGSAATCRNGVS